MTKLIGAIIFITAFIYALYLVIFKKSQPEIKAIKGWKRQFFTAVIMISGLISTLTTSCSSDTKSKPESRFQINQNFSNRKEFLSGLKVIWQGIQDKKDNNSFYLLIDNAIKKNLISSKTGDILKATYEEVSAHYYIKDNKIMCYEASVASFQTIKSKQDILNQAKLLIEMRKQDKVDDETVTKIYSRLAQSMELLYQSQEQDKSNPTFPESNSTKITPPTKDALEAAEIILLLENIKLKPSADALKKNQE